MQKLKSVLKSKNYKTGGNDGLVGLSTVAKGWLIC